MILIPIPIRNLQPFKRMENRNEIPLLLYNTGRKSFPNPTPKYICPSAFQSKYYQVSIQNSTSQFACKEENYIRFFFKVNSGVEFHVSQFIQFEGTFGCYLLSTFTHHCNAYVNKYLKLDSTGNIQLYRVKLKSPVCTVLGERCT